MSDKMIETQVWTFTFNNCKVLHFDNTVWGYIFIWVGGSSYLQLVRFYTYIYFNEYLKRTDNKQEKRVTEACSM